MLKSIALIRLCHFSNVLRTAPRISKVSRFSSDIPNLTSNQRNTMATTTTKPSAEGNTISAVAQQEGGTAKGSTSAAMQSELTRQRNAERAEDEVSSKLANASETVTSDDARYVQSREVRATGAVTSDLPSTAAKQAAANQAAANDTSAARVASNDPSIQSQLDREANYVEEADKVQTKLETDPSSITKEEADAMHRREQRAFGHTDKGGLAAKAQSQAAKNK